MIPIISKLLLNQTTSILIVAYLGPAALALYARPWSLVRHMHALVNGMAMTLIPVTSSLQSTKDLEGIRLLLIKSVRYSFYLALPMVLVLVVFGGQILRFWMGQRYANGLIPAVLGIGYLTTMVQLPAWHILMGLNAHGRMGIAQLVASVCSIGLTVVALGYLRWGLAGIAVAVMLPLTVMNVIYLPHLVCRRLDLEIRQYLYSVLTGPILHVGPFAVCLLIARLVFSTEPLIGLLWGGIIGSAILGISYYRYVLPARIKMRIFPFRIVSTQKLD